jgi:RES domain-containing protein
VLTYRITSPRYAKDLSGAGARLFSGRWNHKGTAIVYTSESRALATAEYVARVPSGMMPGPLGLLTIETKDGVSIEEIDIKALPKNWRNKTSPLELANIGTKWVRENRSLILRVPSAVVLGDFNILINPSHPEIGKVKVKSVEPYELDERLLRLPHNGPIKT